MLKCGENVSENQRLRKDFQHIVDEMVITYIENDKCMVQMLQKNK